MYGFVYKLTCRINDKPYIGQTIRSLDVRFREHATADSPIGNAIRKYGEENFSREVLEECDTPEQLNERERYWIAYFNSKVPNGYNLTDGGDGRSSYVCSDKTRALLSAARANHPLSAETYAKISAKLKGRPRPLEVVARIAAANTGKPSPFKGKKRDPSIGAKISAANKGRTSPMKGKHHSDATKAKIAASNTGKTWSDEMRRKSSISHMGIPQSDETRKKRSVKLTGRFQRRRPTVYPVLEELLVLNKINDTKLAAHLGLSQPTVSRKLGGKVNFSPAQMSATKKFLGTDLSVEELFRRIYV